MPLKTNPSAGAHDYKQRHSAIATVAVSVGGGDQTLTDVGRGIYVGGAGNLVCRLVGDSADSTFTGLTAGSYYPWAISIIRQTGTTITNSLILF